MYVYAHVLSSDYMHRVFIITVVQMYLLPQNVNAMKNNALFLCIIVSFYIIIIIIIIIN